MRSFKKIMSLVLAIAIVMTGITLANTKTTMAATTVGNDTDYVVTATDVSGSQTKITFNATNYAAYVIIHYKVNDGAQQNVGMAGSNTTFETAINGVKTGDTIKCSFTYNKNGLQYDSKEMSYKVGQATNTNTNLEAPFGLVVNSPANNTVSVVWGRGNINSYNVYIDNTKVASAVACGYYEYKNVAAGTHTVSVTTVNGSSESAKTSLTVNVNGQTQQQTTTQNYNNNSNVPQLRTDIPARSDKMFLQLNNKTNGKYSDNQIYWIVIGRNKNHEICYLDTNGNLIKASESLNTITKNGRKCANIAHSMAEASYVYLPDIESGRMYLSYGEPVYITFNKAADGTIGYAGPDLNNASDPNSDVLFEFAEFTVTNKEYWGNTTRVDFFSFPVVTRLVGQGGFDNRPGDYDVYDKTVGDIGTRDEIFRAWQNSAPSIWQSLYDGKRIMAPCKTSFNEGQVNGHYFDAYINEFWNKYSNETLVFKCDAGTFRGKVSGDRMIFTKDGDGGTYTIYKPTTQDVLEGRGNFNRGNSTELVIEAQLCAAFNRGVATDPANYQNPSAYYKSGTYNYYCKFMHEHSVNNYSYGFCYDDVNDQSTLLHYTNPTALILDLKW